MRRFDAIVVGCGAMGSSVAYNLALRGVRTLALERFHLNHEFGSSHGGTRIIRLAYFEDQRYVPLLRRAYDSWEELGRKAAREVMVRTGGLMIGRPEGPLLKGVLRSASVHSLPHRVLSGGEVEDEFPCFELGGDLAAVHDPAAGILFPEQCIESYVRLAAEQGAEIRFNEPVVRWRGGDDQYEVETREGVYLAKRLVFCAGAWTSSLLPGTVPLQVERQSVFWFRSTAVDLFRPGRMPVFVMEENPGLNFYGIPDVGNGIKVARHHGGRMVDPDRVERRTRPADSSPVKRFVRIHLPLLAGPPVSSSVCLYSNTPDGNFVVDHHPRDPGVTVVSACSGHGFKFASVLGEVAADIVVGKRVNLDVSFLGIRRFAARESGPGKGFHNL